MNDFWQVHEFLFLVSMFFFPRLTMLFATTFGGGILYWLGWVFVPRCTAATIATYLYGHSNTTLVVFAWIWAFCGDFCETTIEKNAYEKINSRF